MANVLMNHSGTETESLRRRCYALTDNGDWMEMLPAVEGEPFTGSGVSFLVVDAADEDDFFAQADAGDGEILGRVTVVDGAPAFYPAEALDEE